MVTTDRIAAATSYSPGGANMRPHVVVLWARASLPPNGISSGSAPLHGSLECRTERQTGTHTTLRATKIKIRSAALTRENISNRRT